jgi:hypothetical protein
MILPYINDCHCPHIHSDTEQRWSLSIRPPPANPVKCICFALIPLPACPPAPLARRRHLQQDFGRLLTYINTSFPSGLIKLRISVAMDCIDPSGLHFTQDAASLGGAQPVLYSPFGHSFVSVALVKWPGGVTACRP